MFQHNVTPVHPYASRSRLMQRRRLVGFFLTTAGGMVLTCVALSLRPGLTECTALVQCEGWYPLAPIGLLFVFMKGPPDTPTIHLGVRRPEQALPKIWNICYNQWYGCAAHQTRHL